MHNLHCGACMEEFQTTEELNDHIESCPAARILLPYIYIVSLAGADAIGHPVSHFIHLTHKHAHTIKRYAYAVADDMPVFERSKIHSKLCEDLGIKYDDFRPFDSEVFDPAAPEPKMPTREEAEEILWMALVEHFKLNELLKEQREREK